MADVVHISDLHFGDADPAMVDRAGALIADLDPCVIAVTGDLTQKGRKSEFAEAESFLGELKAPKVIAPGNHDTPYAHLLTRIVAPFARFQTHLTSSGVGLLKLDGVWIRTVNTAKGVQSRVDWSLGSISVRATERAAEELARAPPDACRIVACHHPLITPGAAPFPARTRGGVMAAERFARAGVDLVLAGHLHVPYAEPLPFEDRRTFAVGAGTAFSPRTRGEPASFNLLRISRSTIMVITYAWDGADFREASAATLDRRPRGNRDAA